MKELPNWTCPICNYKLLGADACVCKGREFFEFRLACCVERENVRRANEREKELRP